MLQALTRMTHSGGVWLTLLYRNAATGHSAPAMLRQALCWKLVPSTRETPQGGSQWPQLMSTLQAISCLEQELTVKLHNSSQAAAQMWPPLRCMALPCNLVKHGLPMTLTSA